MHPAGARLRNHFASVNRSDAYTGEFYPGSHRFDTGIQAAACTWLRER